MGIFSTFNPWLFSLLALEQKALTYFSLSLERNKKKKIKKEKKEPGLEKMLSVSFPRQKRTSDIASTFSTKPLKLVYFPRCIFLDGVSGGIVVDIMEGSPLTTHYWEQLIILLFSWIIITYQVFELIWRKQRSCSYAMPVRRTEIWLLPKKMDRMTPQICLFSTPREKKGHHASHTCLV